MSGRVPIATEGVHCSLCTVHRLWSSVNPCLLSLAYSSVKDLTKMPLESKSNAIYSIVPFMEIDHILKQRDHENNPNIYVPNPFVCRLKNAYLGRTNLFFTPDSNQTLM